MGKNIQMLNSHLDRQMLLDCSKTARSCSYFVYQSVKTALWYANMFSILPIKKKKNCRELLFFPINKKLSCFTSPFYTKSPSSINRSAELYSSRSKITVVLPDSSCIYKTQNTL